MNTRIDEEMKYYLEGIENEFFLDKDAMKRDGIIDTDFVLVRYMKFRMFFANRKIYRLILGLIIRFWWLIHPIISFYYFSQLFIKRIFISYGHFETSKPIKIFMVSSGTSERIRKDNFNDESLINVEFPWLKTKSELDENVYSLLYFIGYQELLSLMIENRHLQKYIKSKVKKYDKSIILQTYDSYNWLVVYFALRNIKPKELYFTNHYDRWAILFDRAPFIERKNQVQHGILNKEVRIKNKLHNLQKCYYFDDTSKKIFENNYHSSKNIVYMPYNKKFNVTAVFKDKTILFIGGPYDSKKEIELIKRLCVTFPYLNIVIKPHPVYSSNIYESIVGKNVFVFKKRNIYPRAEVVISYESTLGVEYMKKGIPVIFHNDLTNDEIIIKIRTMIV